MVSWVSEGWVWRVQRLTWPDSLRVVDIRTDYFSKMDEFSTIWVKSPRRWGHASGEFLYVLMFCQLYSFGILRLAHGTGFPYLDSRSLLIIYCRVQWNPFVWISVKSPRFQWIPWNREISLRFQWTRRDFIHLSYIILLMGCRGCCRHKTGTWLCNAKEHSQRTTGAAGIFPEERKHPSEGVDGIDGISLALHTTHPVSPDSRNLA